MQLHSISLAHSCRLDRSHKNKTAMLENKLGKAEINSFHYVCQTNLNNIKEQLNESK